MSIGLEVSAASKEGGGSWDGMREGEGVLEGLTGQGRTPAWTPSELRDCWRRHLVALDF